MHDLVLRIKNSCVRADVDFSHACCSNDCSLRTDAVAAITLSVSSRAYVSVRWLT